MKLTVGVESEPVHTEVMLPSLRLSTIPLDNLVTPSSSSKSLQNTPEGSTVSLASLGWVWGHLHAGKLIDNADKMVPPNIPLWISLEKVKGDLSQK